MGVTTLRRAIGRLKPQSDSAYASEFLVAPRGSSTVALHLPSGTYFELDAKAAEILGLLVEAGSAAAAASLLSERYQLPRSQAAADIVRVLDALRRGGAARVDRGRRPTLHGTAAVTASWLRLPVRRRAAVARAALDVIAIELALALLPLDRVARLFGAQLADGPGEGPGRALTPEDFDEVELLGIWAARWVLRAWLYDATCLRQALASARVLRRRSPRLHVGLVDNEDALAHAWLSIDDASLDGWNGAIAFALPGKGDPT